MIQTAVLNFLLEIAVISFIFPVVFVLVWKMRHHKSFRPVFIGMGAYFVFSQLFTSIPYMILIQAGHPFGKVSPFFKIFAFHHAGGKLHV